MYTHRKPRTHLEDIGAEGPKLGHERAKGLAHEAVHMSLHGLSEEQALRVVDPAPDVHLCVYARYDLNKRTRVL
jgi:hypothetical protein